MAQASDLSVIIVNYKSSQLTLDCLRTVYGETTGIDLEVIVVDNGSMDDSHASIMQRFPAVRWIAMDYNAGFARANNAAIRQSSGRILLFLNPDVLIENQAINRCIGLFEPSEYIACGIQLLNEDRSPQISGLYFVKGGLNLVLPLPYLGACCKWMGGLLKIKSPSIRDTDQTVEVDWISGAFLMVKRAAIAKAGVFDEDFFLYSEEAEWCSRLGFAGRLCIFGQIRSRHLLSETSNQIFGSRSKAHYNLYDQKGLQMMLSNFVRLRKQFGSFWFLLMLLIYLLEVPVFFLGILISGIFVRRPVYSFRLLGQYVHNILYVARMSPRIVSGKPYFYKVL